MTASRWLLAFGFVSPWLLAAGLALSVVPLVIHLLRRRQQVDRPWAAMQFLQAALHSQARRVRLESLALLAIRTLIIALAATALARPLVEESGGSPGKSAGRQRVLVIDTSLSMSAGETGATSLDRARALAAQVVESAPAGDAFSLVTVARTPPLAVIPQAAHDRNAVLEQIRHLASRQESGDVLGALRAVRDCLRHSGQGPRGEIIIVSDFQRTNWRPDSEKLRREMATLLRGLADHATVTCLPVSPAVSANLAVTQLEPVADPGMRDHATDVEATILNTGSQPAVGVAVEAFSNDHLLGAASVDVPPGESATVRIPLRGLSPTDAFVRVEIPHDSLDDDNRRWSVLPDRGPVEVLLVSGRPRTSDRRGAADFVRLALSPAGARGGETAIAATVINDDRLSEIELRRFNCIHLCNVALLSESDARRLRAYVEDGGGLVISLGDHVQSGGYRVLQQPADRPLFPGELAGIADLGDSADDAVRFAPGDYAHPVIRPFAGNPDAGLTTTEIRRYWQLRLADEPAVEVVLNYSTGDPAIIERRFGAGRVFVITTALDDTWSNWALWPSFVPIVHEVTRAAASGGKAERSRIVGDELTLSLSAEEFGVNVEYLAPGGAAAAISRRSRADGTSVITTVAESAGVHELHLGSPRSTVERFAVNIDPAECWLAAVDREQLTELMPAGSVRLLREWRAEASVAAVTQNGAVSSLLIVAVLGLLLVEQLMAWRFRFGAAGLALLALGLVAAAATGRNEFALPGLALLTPAVLLTGWRRSKARAPRLDRSRF